MKGKGRDLLDGVDVVGVETITQLTTRPTVSNDKEPLSMITNLAYSCCNLDATSDKTRPTTISNLPYRTRRVLSATMQHHQHPTRLIQTFISLTRLEKT